MTQSALLELGRHLLAARYQFVTPTPLSHERVTGRGRPAKIGLRDIFGWNFPFRPDEVSPHYLDILENGDLLNAAETGLRSRVRFSSIGDFLFAHSAFPTLGAESVFFGPDTYRFVRAIRQALTERPAFRPAHIVDIGAGSGAGGLCCAALFQDRPQVTLVDINDKALEFSRANAALNGIAADTLHSNLLSKVHGLPDLIISNPPYLADSKHRIYRDGGGQWGFDLSLRIVTESLERLHPDGLFLLYTGTPIVTGTDKFLAAVQGVLRKKTTAYQYDEIDPDVFGEELEGAPYNTADRIAAVLLLVDGKNIRR